LRLARNRSKGSSLNCPSLARAIGQNARQAQEPGSFGEAEEDGSQ
jgi:hypothetical protein